MKAFVFVALLLVAGTAYSQNVQYCTPQGCYIVPRVEVYRRAPIRTWFANRRAVWFQAQQPVYRCSPVQQPSQQPVAPVPQQPVSPPVGGSGDPRSPVGQIHGTGGN